MNPAEGTILTVFREATEYAAERTDENTTIEDFLSMHIEEAKRSLARTKDILPALQEADVIDSGGAGYVCIATGMYAALTGESFDDYKFTDEKAEPAADISAFTRDSVLEFGYCTEFLLRLQTAKTDPDTFDVKVITDFLESIGGDSVVAYRTDDVVKVHVHTMNPGAVLTEMRNYGEFLTVKIENMSNKPLKKACRCLVFPTMPPTFSPTRTTIPPSVCSPISWKNTPKVYVRCKKNTPTISVSFAVSSWSIIRNSTKKKRNF